MNTKTFCTLSLLAYVGSGACSGMNMNRMDEKEGIKIKKEIEKEPGTSIGANVTEDSKKEYLRRRTCVEKLNEFARRKFGNELPEQYRNFLVENDPNTLEKLNVEPFRIFSFDTPDNVEEDLKRIVKETKSDQIGMISYYPKGNNKIKKPWCIAVCSREREYEGEHEHEAQEYYYIDLYDDHKDNSIYKMKVDGSLESINRRLEDFINFCVKESLNIKRSLEKIIKNRNSNK